MDEAAVGGQPTAVEWSWVDFSMGEDVRSESRLLQDDAWRNAVSDGRAHVSRREYSDLHSTEFINAIDDYKIVNLLLSGHFSKDNILGKLSVETLRHIVEFALPGQGPLVVAGIAILNVKAAATVVTAALTPSANNHSAQLNRKVANSFRICARCRPLLSFEKQGGAYNSVDTNVKFSEIIVHDGRLARGGRWLTMSHKTFSLDKVWKLNASNDDVCSSEVEPLLAKVKDGHSCSLLCFGQTGTGKTYTLVAALAHVLKSLENTAIEITFYEIHGKKCYDLLSQRKVVHLRSDENEVVHIRGARSICCYPRAIQTSVDMLKKEAGDKNDADEMESRSSVDNADTNETVEYGTLVNLVQEALRLRSSQVTERNPISSRSHAVCVIKCLSCPGVQDKKSVNSSSGSLNADTFDGEKKYDKSNYYGKLTLLDLAGSERNYETTKMTAVQHRESADINFALMALKDCFRAYHAQSVGSQTLLTRECSSSQMRGKIPGGIDSALFLNIKPINDASTARAPYRASPLTRVLRECFVVDDINSNSGINKKRHHTTIITTLSPTPTDIQHSLNSLDHVVMMKPSLEAKVHDVIVEVPLFEGFLSGVPIDAWTAEQVIFWLSTTNNGRFAQLALPPGLDGNGLMKLNMVSLSALCEGTLRAARQDEEGSAWVVQGDADEDISATAKHNYLGRALWAALRREHQLQRLSSTEKTS